MKIRGRDQQKEVKAIESRGEDEASQGAIEAEKIREAMRAEQAEKAEGRLRATLAEQATTVTDTTFRSNMAHNNSPPCNSRCKVTSLNRGNHTHTRAPRPKSRSWTCHQVQDHQSNNLCTKIHRGKWLTPRDSTKQTHHQHCFHQYHRTSLNKLCLPRPTDKL